MYDNLIDILIICKFCCTISGHFSTTNVMRQGGVFYPWLLSMIAVSWETLEDSGILWGNYIAMHVSFGIKFSDDINSLLASSNMTLKLM